MEPHFKKSACSYCGDAGVNHALTFIEGCISTTMDPIVTATVRHSPSFLTYFADSVPNFLFPILSFLKIATFSTDINGALSYRSRVVWEEAERRGIHMEQVKIRKRLLEFYRARIHGKWFYFQSLPIPPEPASESNQWDDKILLKREFIKKDIPTPRFAEISFFSNAEKKDFFKTVGPRLIVKPRVGSRGRHTTTGIQTKENFLKAVKVGRKIAPGLVVEEHLLGDVCRATVVGGVLGGFYRASTPFVIGDGVKNITELILEKNTNAHERISPVVVTDEIKDYVARAGYALSDILPDNYKLPLTHRTGRLWGGTTKEMIDELHPSFIPIIERAADILKISVAGFDCIIEDPTKDAYSQRWGIIECNTLPFIDLHYFAFTGKPRNIAGMIWDLWK